MKSRKFRFLPAGVAMAFGVIPALRRAWRRAKSEAVRKQLMDLDRAPARDATG